VPSDKTSQALIDVQLISTLAATVLKAIPQTSDIGALIGPLAILAATALSAYHNAAGIAVTPESVALLLPDMTPLAPPKQ
jgi:hypothetical protein